VSARVDIDEDLLKTIAARTNGEFFRATDSTSMRQVFERIDQLEKSEIKLTAFRRYRELFHPYLVIAALLLAAAGALWAGGLRVLPA
jgi:Ca-activated chloride channel family protein